MTEENNAAVTGETTEGTAPAAQGRPAPPEPPKDADGNPMAPPDGFGHHGHGGRGHGPKPPMGEDGRPLAPPDGHHPPMRPEEDRAAAKTGVIATEEAGA